MTTLRRLPTTCSICGQTSVHTVMYSSNTFGGGPDLDLRPAPMLRNTMHTWIQRCPHCGYCSPKLSEETGITRDFLESDKYLSCNGIYFKNRLAEDFFRYHLICLELNKPEKAVTNALRAAWACDDSSELNNAVMCRLYCLESMKPIEEETDINELLKRADIMRRAGLFDAVIKFYSDITPENPLHKTLIDFHILKSREEDADCYTIKEACDYMAELKEKKNE